jgi:hypothetical protein
LGFHRTSGSTQRLAGLGRTAADSDDRRFTDTYLLDGLRATHVLNIVENDDSNPAAVDWMNPLAKGSILIAASKLSTLSLVDSAIGYCKRHSRDKNKTLLSDIVAVVVRSGLEEIDFGGLDIEGGHCALLDLSGVRISGLHFSYSIIERLILSGIQGLNIEFLHCDIETLEGVSSREGIPDFLKDCNIRNFTSVATVSRIKTSRISPAHKVLVAILRKTYFQKGAARKEEALLRGLGKLVKSGTVDKIINKLIGENLLTKAKGDSGNIYAPVGANRRRVGKIVSELSLSRDPIWQFVEDL